MSSMAETFKSGWKAFVAELAGSAFLVFCGSLGYTRGGERLGKDFGLDRTALLYFGDVGIRFGAALAALAVAIGPVSGAHYNPVVSMGALINSRIEWQSCIFYVLAQLIGSIAGGFLAWCVGGSAMTMPTDSHNGEIKALIVEIIITSFLLLVFLGATEPERGDALKDLAGIAVGLALAAGHWVGVPLSGGSMNPFRTLASALTENTYDHIWIYFVGPPVGAALSAVFYRFVLSGAKESSL